MQEVRDELRRRLTTIANQIERNESEREHHAAEIRQIDSEVQRLRTLETQYQQVVDTLPAPA